MTVGFRVEAKLDYVLLIVLCPTRVRNLSLNRGL